MRICSLDLYPSSHHSFTLIVFGSLFLVSGALGPSCQSVTLFTHFDSLTATSFWPPSVNHLLQWNKYLFLPLPVVGSKYSNISHLVSFPSTLLQHPKWSIISDIGNKCVNTLFKVLYLKCYCGQKWFLSIWHWNCLFQKPPLLSPLSGEGEIIAACMLILSLELFTHQE